MTEEKHGSSENDPDDDKEHSEDENVDENIDPSNPSYRRRRKIKVRKRVRVKKKSSPKKRAQKILETIIWIFVLTAFLVTLIIFFKEMDLKSAKSPSKKSSYLQPSAGLRIGIADTTF